MQYSNITGHNYTTMEHKWNNFSSPVVWPLTPIFLAILSKAFVNQIRNSNQKDTIFQSGFVSTPVTNWYFELASPRVKTKKWDHDKVVQMKEQQNWITLTKSIQFTQLLELQSLTRYFQTTKARENAHTSPRFRLTQPWHNSTTVYKITALLTAM